MPDAAEYRRMAATARQQILDAFDSEDPRQAARLWGLRLSAELAIAKAQLVDRGRRMQAIGLYYYEQRIAARLIKTKWGYRWQLRPDQARRFGRKYLPFDLKGTSHIHKRYHLTQRPEMVPAWAKLIGTESGLGPDDCATAHVTVYRAGDPWGLDAVPCPPAAADLPS